MTVIDGKFQANPELSPLGPPPDRLEGDSLQAWHDLIAASEPGVLCLCDRLYVELVSQTLARVRNATTIDIESFTLLRHMCDKLLLTKKGRRQLGVPGL